VDFDLVKQCQSWMFLLSNLCAKNVNNKDKAISTNSQSKNKQLLPDIAAICLLSSKRIARLRIGLKDIILSLNNNANSRNNSTALGLVN
jgi:hypothetical protein